MPRLDRPWQQRMQQRPRSAMFSNVQVSEDTARGLSIAAMVCGILAIFAVPYLLGPIALALGGIVLQGAPGVRGNHRGMALCGFILGIVAIVIFILSLITGLFQYGAGW
ncbi:DUF4190 domain-containing protein [Streptacidiphilus sp. N1-3]|uniref:DUF4190 domain-containing protein n=1 Tax=Streptacidiphilus alkalitolerans TaxID=3342712 RepID=A0ABV6WTI4_9ACTN